MSFPVLKHRKARRAVMLIRAACLWLGLAGMALKSEAANPVSQLIVRIDHRYNGKPIRFESVSLPQENGATFSVSRWAYLITEFALLRPDGTALRPDGQAAYLNLGDHRTSFTLPGTPHGDYAGIAFRVGVPTAENKREPGNWPAGHALNPAVNGLHWGWQGGYVFLALEGLLAETDGRLHGYSYHLAGDANLMTVRLPAQWRCDGDTELTLQFDLARVLDGIVISQKEGADSTHSMQGDLLATRLKQNVERAFRFEQVSLEEPDGATLLTAPKIENQKGASFPLRVPPGFPQPVLPEDNPLTNEGVTLGGKLFFDPKLSANGTQACGNCHQAQHAFASADRVNTGIDGFKGKRNAPALFNLAWQREFAWDGRRKRLRDQSVAPIEDALEMHQPLEKAVAVLQADAEYPALFEKAFGNAQITGERVGLAIEQFLYTKVAGDSKFDRAIRKEAELTEEEKRGFELFVTERDPFRGRYGADCFHCHGGPLFSDYAFHDTGLDEESQDAGRFVATGREFDRGKFKTPSLRNIAVSGPYMHDGRFTTLEEVVAHYSEGVKRTRNLDPNLAKHPDGGLHLSKEDQKALVAFLKTLTDSTVPESTDGGLAKK